MKRPARVSFLLAVACLYMLAVGAIRRVRGRG
mgnify:FL=1